MVLIAFRKRKIGMRKWVKGHSKKARRAVYGASGIVMTEKDMELAERGNPAESDKATEEAMLAVPPEAIGKMKLRQRERLRWQGNRLMDLFEKNPENLRLLREAQEAENCLKPRRKGKLLRPPSGNR